MCSRRSQDVLTVRTVTGMVRIKTYRQKVWSHWSMKPEERNVIKQRSQNRPDWHQITTQHPCKPQAPTPHGTTGGEGGKLKITCGHHAVIHSAPASQTHRKANSIYLQAKIRFSCHHSEPQSTTGSSTLQDHRGERGGKLKEDAVKLVVCVGGGDHLQAILQAKTSLIVTEAEC